MALTRDWIDYTAAGASAREPVTPIKLLKNVDSPRLGNRRDLLVCLPPSYEHCNRNYPVLFMQDGQNLFDRATSFAEEWRADEVVRTAAAAGREVILVGIPNTGDRRVDEYSPFRDSRQGGGRGKDYVGFVADTVKPLVDEAFRTMPGREYTGIAGSSMGGLISIYALFERPDTFGFAGAMSPALWFARRAIFEWLGRAAREGSRLYIDAGTNEGPQLLADVARLRDLLLERGYRLGADLAFVMEAGGRHDEASWGRRLLGLLRFMLGDASPAVPNARSV